ncbi:type II secretion system F family protein [Olsenella uli]|uniref:type II secretion system F family protein n=1 Tax=Olsenella uli TaxID=133926 RepID=UPI000451E482|nr:type II secretion system F family protein [Olsenella uli]EUB30598.1 type II secretion system protein F [Olsenella uli MSTE5]
MEGLVTCAACGLTAFLSGFALLGRVGPTLRGGARALVMTRRATRVLDALGDTGLVRWLGSLPSWHGVAGGVSTLLAAHAVSLDLRQAVSLLWVSTAALALIAMATSRVLVLGPIAIALSFVAMPIASAALESRRRRAIEREMPAVFRTLAMAMGSGETLSQAVDYLAAHGGGEVAKAFTRTSLRMHCGYPARESLDLLARELDAPGVGLLVTALLISQRTGSPLRSLFRRSARLVERQGEFERMLGVKTAQVRLSVRVVSGLPVIMIALLSLISSDFQRGLSTPVGAACILVAALMDGAAILIIRRLMRGVV